MGTFGVYQGYYNVDEDKRKLFNEQMAKILNYGGMMDFEEVKIYRQEIALLKPFALKEKGRIYFSYNYFEDNSWETARYEPEDASLWTEKIGYAEFADVVTAAYFLYEVYDSKPGFVTINADTINHTEYVGWLNQLLGTGFSMKKRFDLWKNAEWEAQNRLGRDENDLKEDEKNDDFFDELILENIIPRKMEYLSGGVELADLLYVLKGTESLIEGEVMAETYPYDVWVAKKSIIKCIAEYGEESYEKLLEVLKMDRLSRSALNGGSLQEIGSISQYIPARVLMYLFCEQKQIAFWRRWLRVKDEVYHDEQLKTYASRELVDMREKGINAPIPKVLTSEFLKEDPIFEFDLPEEVQRMEKVYTTDDDRMYWWDGSDEVILSEGTKTWLAGLGVRHKEMVEGIENGENECDGGFLEMFLQVINDANEYYKRIFPFYDMFYEFLNNSHKAEYIAAIKLLREIVDAEENRKSGELIKHIGNMGWDISDKRITQNKGRVCVKRYLAVMANQKLRKIYFGF